MPLPIRFVFVVIGAFFLAAGFVQCRKDVHEKHCAKMCVEAGYNFCKLDNYKGCLCREKSAIVPVAELEAGDTK